MGGYASTSHHDCHEVLAAVHFQPCKSAFTNSCSSFPPSSLGPVPPAVLFPATHSLNLSFVHRLKLYTVPIKAEVPIQECKLKVVSPELQVLTQLVETRK